MNSLQFVEALRADIAQGLREEILSDLQPEINRRLYANIFTFAQAAEYLKVSEPTLRRMIADKSVPHFYQRTNVYFRQWELDAHISSVMIRPTEKGKQIRSAQ